MIRPPPLKRGAIFLGYSPPRANLLGISPPRGANLLGISVLVPFLIEKSNQIQFFYKLIIESTANITASSQSECCVRGRTRKLSTKYRVLLAGPLFFPGPARGLVRTWPCAVFYLRAFRVTKPTFY